MRKDDTNNQSSSTEEETLKILESMDEIGRTSKKEELFITIAFVAAAPVFGGALAGIEYIADRLGLEMWGHDTTPAEALWNIAPFAAVGLASYLAWLLWHRPLMALGMLLIPIWISVLIIGHNYSLFPAYPPGPGILSNALLEELAIPTWSSGDEIHPDISQSILIGILVIAGIAGIIVFISSLFKTTDIDDICHPIGQGIGTFFTSSLACVFIGFLLYISLQFMVYIEPLVVFVAALTLMRVGYLKGARKEL